MSVIGGVGALGSDFRAAGGDAPGIAGAVLMSGVEGAA